MAKPSLAAYYGYTMKLNSSEFQRVIEEGAALQSQLPWLSMVAVGGTAAAIHAGHRYSTDTDHVSPLLKNEFEVAKAGLCDWEGWKTNRIRRPYAILGERHGIQLGLRQQRRVVEIDAEQVQDLWVPTIEETLRIKAYLATDRQATRDFLDIAALADVLGEEKTVESLSFLNVLYPGEGNQSCLTRFAEVMHQAPLDLDMVDLRVYKGIKPPYDNWQYIEKKCQDLGKTMLEMEMQSGVATTLEDYQNYLAKQGKPEAKVSRGGR